MSERGHGLDPWPVSRKRREVVCCTIFDDIGKFSNYIRHVPLLQKMQCFEAHIFDNSKSSEQYFALIQELIETSSQRLSLVETRSNVQRQVIAQKHIDAKSETAAFFEQYAKETTYVVDAVGHVIANRMRVENVRNEPSGTPFTAASQAAVDGEEKDMILRGRVEAKEEAKLVPKTSLSEILRNRAASTGNLDANDDHQKADGTGISSNVASNSRNASQQIRILHIENDAKSSLQVKAKEPTGKQVARKGDVAPPTTGHKAVKAPARGIRQTEIAKAIPQRSKAKPIAAKMSSDVGNRDFSKAGVRKTTKPTAKTHTQKRVLENQRSTESVKGAVKVKEEPEAKKRRLDALMDKWPVTHERRTGVINALRETLYQYCNNYNCPTLTEKIHLFEAEAFRCSQSTAQYYGLVKDTIQFVDDHICLAEVRKALKDDVADVAKARERKQKLNSVLAEAVWRFLEQGGNATLAVARASIKK